MLKPDPILFVHDRSNNTQNVQVGYPWVLAIPIQGCEILHNVAKALN